MSDHIVPRGDRPAALRGRVRPSLPVRRTSYPDLSPGRKPARAAKSPGPVVPSVPAPWSRWPKWTSLWVYAPVPETATETEEGGEG